jgi:hypothetical protein
MAEEEQNGGAGYDPDPRSLYGCAKYLLFRIRIQERPHFRFLKEKGKRNPRIPGRQMVGRRWILNRILGYKARVFELCHCPCLVPVFEDMEIYKDGKESFFHKFYEGAAIKLIKLFEGDSDEQTPVETRISGSLGHGNGDTWSAVAAVARDAFSNAILPAFKREAKRLRQGS